MDERDVRSVLALEVLLEEGNDLAPRDEGGAMQVLLEAEAVGAVADHRVGVAVARGAQAGTQAVVHAQRGRQVEHGYYYCYY